MRSTQNVDEPSCSYSGDGAGLFGQQVCEEKNKIMPKKKSRNFKEPQNDDIIDSVSNKRFAPQSKRKIKWAVNMFCDWRTERLSDHGVPMQIQNCDLDRLSDVKQGDLAYSLSRFVREIKKLDGTEYPPNTLREIVIMIQMHLHENGVYWKLLDHPEFLSLRNVLDNTMRERTAMGLGVKQSSDIISLANENKLFEIGELGDNNPQQLLNTVIYMVGLHFALRGGVEHQRLRRPGFRTQIEFVTDHNNVERLVYKEDPLQKTIQGGIGCKNSRKIVHVYPASDERRCPVRILKKYIRLMPPPKTCQKFYLRPRPKFTHTVWYCDQPYGNHKLSSTIKLMCAKAGLKGKFTNHSLRATSASRMYENDIPEQVIKEITGHHSECVRTYKRTPESIKERASMTISGPGTSKCNQNETESEQCIVEGERKTEVDDQLDTGNAMKRRLNESLSACNIIKNVIKTRLEMRKKQGDKQKVCKRKVAQKLVKKQKRRISKKLGSRQESNRIVIDLNVNLKQ